MFKKVVILLFLCANAYAGVTDLLIAAQARAEYRAVIDPIIAKAVAINFTRASIDQSIARRKQNFENKLSAESLMADALANKKKYINYLSYVVWVTTILDISITIGTDTIDFEKVNRVMMACSFLQSTPRYGERANTLVSTFTTFLDSSNTHATRKAVAKKFEKIINSTELTPKPKEELER